MSCYITMLWIRNKKIADPDPDHKWKTGPVLSLKQLRYLILGINKYFIENFNGHVRNNLSYIRQYYAC